MLGLVYESQADDHDRQPGDDQPGKPAMAGESLDVHRGPIEASEGTHEAEKAEEPQYGRKPVDP